MAILLLVLGQVALSIPASATGKVALVIGNSTYGPIGDLENPGNDATDIGAALGRLGFSVTTVFDVDQFAFNQALMDFTRRSAAADIAIVFYAGHGLEIDGVNYLVPVNARLERDTDVRFAAVSLDHILAATQGAALRIVILDACRNNPLARTIRRTGSTRSMSQGSLGAVDEDALGDETLVAYAAAAGTTAADGTGRNSPYTAALLEYMEQPLELSSVFRRVRARVLETTRGSQRPHEYGSLLSDHYLSGAFGATAPALTALQVQQELVFWQSIANSDNPADFEAYLEQYADGQFARLATNRLTSLREAGSWAVIMNSENPADFAAYLEQYADGVYAPLARQRFAVLSASPKPEAARLAPPATAPRPTIETVGARVESSSAAVVTASASGAPDPPEVMGAIASIASGADPGLPEPGATFRDCIECPEMVVVSAGSFRMGSADGQSDEQPLREVRVEAFALGKHEVSHEEFGAFARVSGYAGDGCNVVDNNAGIDWDNRTSWQDPGFGFAQEDRHPVVCVSWEDAQAYTRWLSLKTGERYRLPSEAEWEYGARAGTSTSRYWGSRSGSTCDHANGGDRSLLQRWRRWPFPVNNCEDGAPHTREAGSYAPNGFGLHDMLGNVWEWTTDCAHETYQGAPTDGSAWIRGGDCERRVLRGGAWDTPAFGIRAANRYWYDNRAGTTIGFRVARDLRSQPQP
ncbi:MAG: SUMF1/EgtB/PvdO family nonheme iron enzyme [Acidobacteria bacterium]|nr:SUMF1/EgtB/PvdO family nonheme iron enzyme [Acidobacteriota bacterium]